jgi:hypothetical protein
MIYVVQYIVPQSNYYAQKQERSRAYQRAYYAKNWEHILANQRFRYARKIASDGEAFRKINNARTKRSRAKLGLQHRIFMQARNRANKAGIKFTIKPTDIVWNKRCPVWKTKLNYAISGRKKLNACNQPSLDRWINKKGYVRGNVFVISLKANRYKGNLTANELKALARYAAMKC